MPSANSDSKSINPYNPGAGICFDCHETARSGTTPWGYNSTFGAEQPILGYKDTPRFGQGVKGSAARSSSRQSRTTIISGHLATGAFQNYSTHGNINGLCTPCHDPHGISLTLGDKKSYAFPMLKGTWLTSPYKEDAPPPSLPQGGSSARDASGGVSISWDKGNMGEGPPNQQPSINYGIDRNTFGADGRISEDDKHFAGLCFNCHKKENLAGPGPAQWVHRATKGWGENREHSFPCSKCHQAHNSGLPHLLQTNCLNAGPASVRDRSNIPWNASAQVKSINVGETDSSKKAGKQNMVGCHVKRGGNRRVINEPPGKRGEDQWNKVTPW